MHKLYREMFSYLHKNDILKGVKTHCHKQVSIDDKETTQNETRVGCMLPI